jgi:hypothetical protein
MVVAVLAFAQAQPVASAVRSTLRELRRLLPRADTDK